MPRRGFIQSCPIQLGCICDPTLKQYPHLRHVDYQQRLEQEANWKRIVIPDCVFCICLEERTDRFETSQREFHRVGLCRMLRYYRVFRPSVDECTKQNITRRGRFGCWNSHTTLAQEIQEICKSLKPVALLNRGALVFEDDIVFCSLMTTAIADKTCRHLQEELPDTWEMYKLGQATTVGYPVNLKLDLFRNYSLMTHAFLLSPKGIRRVAESSFLDTLKTTGEEMHVDAWMLRNIVTYATRPMLVMQDDSDSSNTTTATQGLIPVKNQRWRRHYNECDLFAYIYSFAAIVVVLVVCILGLWFGIARVSRMWSPKSQLKHDTPSSVSGALSDSLETPYKSQLPVS